MLLAIGVAIRTLGAALYYPFLALFLFSVMGVGYLEIGVIFVVVGAIQLPFGLVGGLWADRVGRRRLILLSLVTESAATASLAYAFEIRSLYLAVFVAALGGAILSATGAAFSSYLADWSTGSGRTRAFTWYRITFNGGYSAGVALGGTLVGVIGYAGALLVAATIISVAAAFVAALLPPSPVDLALRAGPPPDPNPGAAPGNPRRSVGESLRILSRDRAAILVAVAFVLVYVTIGQWSVTYPLFVHNKLGISYALLGAGLALNGVIVVVGQAFTTESLIGWRHTSIAILGTLLYVGAFLLLGVAALWVLLPAALFVASVVILTFGENVASIPQSTLPSNLAPEGEVGAYNGGFNTVYSAAGLGAIFLGGAVLSYVANPLLEWGLMVLPAIPGIVLLRLAARRITGRADRA